MRTKFIAVVLILCGCASPYMGDPYVEEIKNNHLSYLAQIDMKVSQGILSPSAADQLKQESADKGNALIARHNLKNSDPALAQMVDETSEYIEQIRMAKDRGEINQAQFEDSVYNAKMKLATFAQQRAALKQANALAEQQADANRLALYQNWLAQRHQNRANCQTTPDGLGGYSTTCY